MLHFPVLLEESLDFLIHKKNGNYIDCTYGRGGHTSAILNRIDSSGQLTSFDKDLDAFNHASLIKADNFKAVHSSFNKLEETFPKESIDGILYDLGTCSTHFDEGNRGFSFLNDGPLDMRFNVTRGKPLSEWINNAPQKEIMDILYKYGDEKHAKIISRSILEERSKSEIVSTKQLANIIEDVYPEKRKKIHPATKSFQAFRIHINDELDELKQSLTQASNILVKEGIIVVISFHSLEDNIVKEFFKPSVRNFPKDIPLNMIEEKDFTCIAKKIRPTEDEINLNKRSRSAIMRVFKKI